MMSCGTSSRGAPGSATRAERLEQADDQIAAIGERPQVVEIAVVQADLQDHGDQARPPQQVPADQPVRPDRRARIDAPRAPRARSATCSMTTSDDRARSVLPGWPASHCQFRLGERGRVWRRRVPSVVFVLASTRSSTAFSTTPRMRRGRWPRSPSAPRRYGVWSGAHDEQRAVDHRRQQAGVGEQADRRRVDDHPVEPRRALVQDLAASAATSGCSSDPGSGGRPAAASACR